MSRQQNKLSSSSLGAEGDSEDGIPPRPKRPLTVFNLFGKLERNYIVQSSQKRAPVPLEIRCMEGIASERSPNAVDPYLELRPAKYRHISLPHDWYKVGQNKTDRKFYKTHGIIKFQELSNVVADRWGKVDDETKQFVQTIYDRELVEYRKEVEEHNKLHGKGKANKRRKVEATKLAATGSSPSDQSMAVSQRYQRTSTVSATASYMAQGRTSSPTYDSSKKPPSANVSHANPPASTQRSNASSSHYHWNELLNSYLASWQVNSCPSETGLHGNTLSSTRPHFSQLQNSSHHFDSHPAMNHYTSSTNTTCDSGYVAMQNRTAGCSGSENHLTSYCPLNQSSGATFQLGNSVLNSSTGSDNSGMSIGIQATGMSSTATSSAFNQSMSNPPSGFANYPHTQAQMPLTQIAVPTMQMPSRSQLQNSSYHLGLQPAVNQYTRSTNTCNSGYNNSSENPSTSYCPFNQSSGATFQLGNSLLNSSTGSDNSVMSIGIQATGMSSTATSSAFNQSMSNQPSGLANHPHAYARMHNHGSLDDQIAAFDSDSN